jgi:hypothetical protein
VEAGDERLENVYKVDKEVKNEAPGNPPMKERGNFAMAQDVALTKQGYRANDETFWQVVEIEFALASLDDAENLPKGVVRGYPREDQQEKEQYFFDSG